jgi:Flp pilus assembly protein TadG
MFASSCRRLAGDRGAAAVEFALVAPVLMLLLFGIVDFSKVFQVEATLAQAAREGVRVMALQNDPAAARAAVQLTAGSVPLTTAQIGISPSTCTGAAPTATVTVTITFRQPFVSGLLGSAGMDVSAKAVMRCGG